MVSTSLAVDDRHPQEQGLKLDAQMMNPPAAILSTTVIHKNKD